MYRPVAIRPLAEADARRLWHMNLGVGLLFVAVTGVLLSETSATVPVYYNAWIRVDGGFRLATGRVDSGVYVQVLSVLFTLLAAADHLWVATWGRARYEACVAAETNPYRWTEYALSASLMNVLIAMLSGVLDVGTLGAIGALTATCMAFGWIGERNAETALAVFWLGCVPFLAVWALVFASFGVNVVESEPPGFVWAIVIGLFVLESLFGWNQQRQVPYLTKEKTFILLSPTAKLLLAFLTWFGTRSL